MKKINVAGLRETIGAKYPKPFDEPCRKRAAFSGIAPMAAPRWW